ncbi:sugar lactone lactonase YvrE [Branchiibius hedensis]|uniref:Sugar lactone lactonase YvrE n=1 Tax=Branchiibius hedensis TaxID=672460 RepID=A0A2Y9BUB7_9MICO|nr:SMP-30/gluconolactonase/LRE family protein [Branchiibius hedensis]PWJ26651.1 sugar lactone lactonase YvrE [Branchiibius hedensis]SSA35462.1 Sugar lactone lactonase YvrE [Branchiibius hedensis]
MAVTTQIVKSGLGAPESLRWHDDALWFVDMVSDGGVWRKPLDGDPEFVTSVPGRVSGIGWLPDGRLLAVSMDERIIYRLEHDGSLAQHADFSDIASGDGNDLYVDPEGRAYVGNFGFDLHASRKVQSNSMLYAPPGPPSTPLAIFDADGQLLGKTDPLLFPNGMVVLGDGRTLVVAETLGMRLTAFTIADDGTLTDRRVWASLIPAPLWSALNHPGPLGRVTRRVSAAVDVPALAKYSNTQIAPDGIGLHSDGQTIWVANPLRNECARVAEGGNILQRVRTRQPALTCVVGGPDHDILFIGTTPDYDPDKALAAKAGLIESIPLT